MTFDDSEEMRATGGQLAFYLEQKDAEATPLPALVITRLNPRRNLTLYTGPTELKEVEPIGDR